MSEPKTSARRVVATERQRQALELRKAGASYEQIKEKLGYRNKTSAYKAVTSALRKMLKEPAEEVRSLEAARLDALTVKLWHDALAGQQGAVDRILRIMDRRAKLLGLDAPDKQIVVEADLEEFLSRLPEEYQSAIRKLIVADFVGGGGPTGP